jgi:hypothetical protein
MCKHGRKFCVYIQAPNGKKTKGTYFGRAASAQRRAAFLVRSVRPEFTVIQYNIFKRRVTNVHCGIAKARDCLFSVPWARIAIDYRVAS